MKTAILHTEDHAIVRTFCGAFSDMDHLEEELHNAIGPYAKPAVNIAATGTSYMLELAIPGYRKKDLRVLIEEDVLTISGTASCVPEHYEAVQHFYKKEFCVEAFTRTFLLPEDFDTTTACLKDGILFIYITKGCIRRLPVEGRSYCVDIHID